MTSDKQQSRSADMLSRVSAYIETLSHELRDISLSIHDHPELRYKEKHAHDLLTSYLRQQSRWTVTPSAYGIDTAFVAVYDAPSSPPAPVVSFNAEYAHILEHVRLPGRVVLFGTPAEDAEGGGGKIKLLEAGAYRDHRVDISLISHPGISPDAAIIRTAAYVQYNVEYFGKEAHAAARPWDGINALDALIAAINNVSFMRQQTEPGDVVQYKISHGGSKPNIIHAYAAGVFVLRAPSLPRLERLKLRFQACLDGGATATGAKLQVKEGLGYKNHIPNHVLGRSYAEHFRALGGTLGEPDVEELTAVTQASTDQGDISHVMPSLSPNFWIRSQDDAGQQLGGPHTPDFERAARTAEAHQLALRVAKSLACTALDIMTQHGLLDEAKREFDKEQEE